MTYLERQFLSTGQFLHLSVQIPGSVKLPHSANNKTCGKLKCKLGPLAAHRGLDFLALFNR